MYRFYFVLFIILFPSFLFASQPSDPPLITNVVYITLDGVRWQDVFLKKTHLQKFWKHYAKLGKLYGEPKTNLRIEVASVPISLPSYQSQMTGAIQPCDDNECGRLHIKTLPENLIDTLHLTKQDVVVFSSWSYIDLAAQSIPGSVYTNAGNSLAYDPLTGKPDSTMFHLNQIQSAHITDKDYRRDKYTFAQALYYFKKHKPRFMWMSLGDSDNTAHNKDMIAYHQALAFYDQALDQFIKTLKHLKIDKTTLLIVTTDHGRGNGENWSDHGPEYPESKQTWAFVMNGQLQQIKNNGKIKYYSTLSIRPTIEAALIGNQDVAMASKVLS